MATVFISYRRTDSGGWTGRLYDRLAARLGPQSIFYDVDSVAAGDDFVASIDTRLATSRLLLAVIGPSWLEMRAPDGSRRIDAPGDHVRREIELALERKLPVVPVLVGGAAMPGATALPRSIAPLANKNALTVSDTTFNSDADRLAQAVERTLGVSAPVTAAPRKRRLGGTLAAVGALVALAVAGAALLRPATGPTAPPAAESPAPARELPAPVTPRPARPAIDLAEVLGEERGTTQYCQAFDVGARQMLAELRYGGAVVPECAAPNNVPLLNFVEAWCHGFTDGASQAARQVTEELLSVAELRRRYDLCVAQRRWEDAE